MCITFYWPRVSVIASLLTTITHYSGSNLPREKENGVRLRTQLRWKPGLSLPCSYYTWLSSSTLQSCTKKDGGSHLCLYNSVTCLDNCMFLWTNAFWLYFMAFYLAHTAMYSHKNSHVHYTQRALSSHINFASIREILPHVRSLSILVYKSH